MERVSQVLVEILEIQMENADSRMIVDDFDLFKLLFITFPIMKESTERVLLSMLFQYQNDLQFLLRVFQDLITVVELKDSIDYFPELRSRYKYGKGASKDWTSQSIVIDNKDRKSIMKYIHPEGNSNGISSLLNTNIDRNSVFFEEIVEYSAPDIVRVNVDTLKKVAMDYLDKVIDIFMLVC